MRGPPFAQPSLGPSRQFCVDERDFRRALAGRRDADLETRVRIAAPKTRATPALHDAPRPLQREVLALDVTSPGGEAGALARGCLRLAAGHGAVAAAGKPSAINHLGLYRQTGTQANSLAHGVLPRSRRRPCRSQIAPLEERRFPNTSAITVAAPWRTSTFTTCTACPRPIRADGRCWRT